MEKLTNERLEELIGFYEHRAVEPDFDDIYIALQEVKRNRVLQEQGQLVLIPPKSKYGNRTLDEAIKRASYVCSVTNNDYNRLVLDALIEKQIAEEAALNNRASSPPTLSE